MFTLLFVGANVFTLLIAAVSFVFFLRTPKRKPLNLLVIVLLALIGIQMVLQWASVDSDMPRFWKWFVNLDDDRNLSATLAAGQWVILGLTAMSAGFASKISAFQRIYWGLVGLLFFFVAIDDFYAIHEYLIPNWRITYLIIAGIFGAISLVVFGVLFRRDFGKNPRPWIFMFVGVVILAISGFFTESLLYSACDEMGTSIFCQNWKISTTLEEGIELLGTTLVSAGLLLYVQNRLSEHIWRRSIVLIVGGAVGFVMLLLAYMWVFPSIELNTTADRVSVVYEDNRIALEGYWIPQDVLHPGERLYLWLYWKTLRNEVKTDYRLSVHVIQRPDGKSVAQAERNNIGELPSRIWTLDSVHRKPLHIDLPDDLPTGMYDVAVRVWEGAWQAGWQSTTGLLPIETDLPLLTDDMVIVASFPILDNQTQSTIQSSYHFSSGIELIGYDVPKSAKAGEQIEFDFTWKVGRDISEDYIHFVHLFHDETEYFTIFDRVPFDNRFPTSGWRAGWTFMDSFSLHLPEDMPAGQYTLRTGLYRASDAERDHITDADGNPVVDWSIPLSAINLDAE